MAAAGGHPLVAGLLVLLVMASVAGAAVVWSVACTLRRELHKQTPPPMGGGV